MVAEVAYTVIPAKSGWTVGLVLNQQLVGRVLGKGFGDLPPLLH